MITQAGIEHLEAGKHIEFEIALESGLTLTNVDVVQGTLVVDMNSAVGNNLTFGSADTTEVSFKIDNHDGRFDEHTFEGDSFVLDLFFADSTLRMGVFTIDVQPKKRRAIEIKALDNMAKFNQPYSTSLSGSDTLLNVLQDACSQCGVVLNTITFTNHDQQVAIPTDTTFHQVVAWVAELAGSNAYIGTNGELYIGWYQSDDPFTITADHRFDYEVENPVTVTGVGYFDGEVETVIGTEGYVLMIEGNGLVMTANIGSLLTNISNKLTGFKFLPYDVSTICLPFLSVTDAIYMTLSDSEDVVKTIITNHTCTINGRSRLRAVGESGQTKGYASAPALTPRQRVIVEALTDSLVNVKTSELEDATLALNQLMANSMGFYSSEVKQSGATIYYSHDQPTLAESTIIYTLTETGFAWTDSGWNDGAPVWQYGITGTGNAILKTLAVHGINADWIQAGQIDTDRIYVGSQTLTNALASMQSQVSALASGSSNLILNATWGTQEAPSSAWWGEKLTWELLEGRRATWNNIEGLTWNDFESLNW